MKRRRQQLKTKKASVEEPSYDARIHDVPDDVLRLILLRLDSPIWLLRAACACKRWRRIITDGGDADAGRSFLRLASSLHAPVVLGQYYRRNCDLGRQWFVPSLPPPPIVDNSRFSFDFLPSTTNWDSSNWKFVECHGGLVLLRYADTSELVVCDPLARRYQGICSPPVPEPDLQAVRRRADDSSFPDVFLLDGDDGHISVSNFRVLYWSDDHVNKRSRAYVFSTTDGGGDWPLLRESELDYSYRHDNVGHHVAVAGRVDGSPYLSVATGSVIALDSASLEFSKVDLPIRVKKSSLSFKQHSFAVVHGGAGAGTDPDFASPRPAACIIHVCADELELFRRVRGSGEWMLEHSIPSLEVASRGLPPGYRRVWMAVDVIPGDTGLVVLKVYLGSNRRWRFAMDVNTMELLVLPDEVPCRELHTWESFNYTMPWPPFLCACACPS